MNWKCEDFAERMGLGTHSRAAFSGRRKEAIIGRATVDPVTRGMIAAVSTATLDGQGGAENPKILYWYRRQNGQSRSIHLFEVKTETVQDEIVVEEIYYRNKPLLAPLPENQRDIAREIVLDAIREINLHMREGGAPNEILRILNEKNVCDIVGETIALPGQNAAGQYNFRLSDTFNPHAAGRLEVADEFELANLIATGEINTLDAHRRIENGERSMFASNSNTGTTFRADVSVERKAGGIDAKTDIVPVFLPEGDFARSLRGVLHSHWKKTGRQGKADSPQPSLMLNSMKFMGKPIPLEDTDTQIRVLGVFYKIMDMARRRRYPTSLDLLHEFGLLDMVSPIEPPGDEGRFSVVSYLGNGKEQTIEGFGFDLGACKIPSVEWWENEHTLRRESVCLDVGKLIAPKETDWDGGLPDLVAVLKDTKALFITHRHLDHMAALIELTRLGLLKNIEIYGSPRALYILKSQINAELDDKTLLPVFKPLEKEGIVHLGRLSVEYCVDGMDHSTPSTIYRVVGRKTERTQNLSAQDVWGSYLFYGDGREATRPEFLSRGLRSFGIDRQDTLLDVDLTNAKKPGHSPTEADAEANITKLLDAFSDKGVVTGIISTNDRRLKTLYKAFNRTGRNFTAVGHNIEMSLRAHNIHGVDPEYEPVYDKDNVNRFLAEDARANPNARGEQMLPVEYRSRGSEKAKAWLNGDLGRLAVLATGTQGNEAEMYSTIQRFSEGWSTLDADRSTAYRLNDKKQWVVFLDQTAIPGNDNSQKEMKRKLLVNRRVAAVICAIDDGVRIDGLDRTAQEAVIRNIGSAAANHYIDPENGSLCLTGFPVHPSGHGYAANIADITGAANAEWNHGTHNNDPENTRAFHNEICAGKGLRHTGRQFDDFEHIAIDMGASREMSALKSLGHENRSLLLYKIVREFGKFFGGTLQINRVTKLDGNSGYAEIGLLAGQKNTQFEDNVIASGFNSSAYNQKSRAPREPDAAMLSEPVQERRSRGVVMPKTAGLNERQKSELREYLMRVVA